MYIEIIFIVMVTIFATLAAAECGLTLKKAFAPFKLMGKGLFKIFESDKKEEENVDEKTKNKPEGL